MQRAKDGLTHLHPLDGMVHDWPAFWASGTDATDTLERHSRTGRPLGDDAFIHTAERMTGRSLQRRKPGPRPKA